MIRGQVCIYAGSKTDGSVKDTGFCGLVSFTCRWYNTSMKYIHMSLLILSVIFLPIIYAMIFIVWFPIALLGELSVFLNKFYKVYKAVDNSNM